MRCRTNLIVLCALSIVAKPSLAADETVSDPSSSSSSSSQSPAAGNFASHSSLGLSKDQFAGDKRVAAFRTEYKRLPLLAFGLGKRFAPSFNGANKVGRADLSFGIGKRSLLSFSGGQDKRLISRLLATGLGKRAAPRYTATGLGKRTSSKFITTGLGKRLQSSYVMGLGKRGEYKNVGFGLGKRVPFKDSQFGLGRRASNPAFGLGKRLPNTVGMGLGKRASSAGFGLGKRNYYDDESDEEEQIDYDEVLDAYSQDKRKIGGLGLGKRMMEVYDDLPEEEKRGGNNLGFGMGKRYIVDEDDEDAELFE